MTVSKNKTLFCSSRVAGLQLSGTVSINAEVVRMIAQGDKVLNFTVGEPFFREPEAVRQALVQRLTTKKNGYSMPGGSLVLREAVSTKLRRENNTEYNTDEIVCGIGAKQMILHALMSLVGEGDEVLLPAPFWPSHQAQISLCGAKAVTFPFLGQNLLSDLRSLAGAISEKTKVLILTNPHNPAGYCLGSDTLKSIVKLCGDQKIWIICDEIYEYYTYDCQHYSLSFVAPEARESIVIVSGLSKSFAMTGYRVGYLAADLSLTEQVLKLQSHSTTCLPPFIEEAACVALNGGKALVTIYLEQINENRLLAINILKGVRNLRFLEPNGAFYLFLDLRDWLGRGRSIASSEQFCKSLLYEKFVALVPGEAFGCAGYARLNYGVEREVLNRGLSELVEFMEQGNDST